MNLSVKILSSISDKINSGYPITALATANNYLHEKCPLREAIATKVKLKILRHPKSNKDKFIEKMLAGHKLTQRQISRSIEQYDKGLNCFKKSIPKTRVRSQTGRRYSLRTSKRIRWESPFKGFGLQKTNRD